MNKPTRELSKRLTARGFNQKAENQYRIKLDKILATISKDYKTNVIPLLNDYDYTADSTSADIRKAVDAVLSKYTAVFFLRIANRYATDFVNGIIKHVNGIYSVNAEFSLNVYGQKDLKKVIRNAIDQNVQLIKSLSIDHCNALANILYENIQAGNRPSAIVSAIEDYGVTRNRAKLIARDQTSKVQSAICRYRNRKASFEYFKWEDSHDERVRPTHHEAATRKTPYGIGVYRYDDPPKIDGKPMYPGEDFQCRCIQIPVDEEDVEAFQKRNK